MIPPVSILLALTLGMPGTAHTMSPSQPAPDQPPVVDPPPVSPTPSPNPPACPPEHLCPWCGGG